MVVLIYDFQFLTQYTIYNKQYFKCQLLITLSFYTAYTYFNIIFNIILKRCLVFNLSQTVKTPLN